jgi:hypothetical protein
MSTITGFSDFSPAFKDTFNQGWYLKSQEQSQLWNLISNKVVQNADTFYYKRLGTATLNSIGAKGTETQFSALSIDQRGIHLAQYGRADLLSYDEIIKMGGEDPTGQLVQRHAEAVGIKRDEVIINAFLGSATVKGGAAVALPAGQTVAANYDNSGVDTGLTLSKVRRAKVLLDKKGVSTKNRIAIVNSEALDQLLAIAQVGSADYNAVKPLVEGTIARWYGFTWVVSNLCPVDGSNIADFIFADADAVKIGYNDMPSTTIDRLPTHNNNFAIQTATFIGAVRMEEEAVVKVKAKIA